MKRLAILYSLLRIGETAETNVTLQMTDEAADDILSKQRDSLYVLNIDGKYGGLVQEVLYLLALLQGYSGAEFISSQEWGAVDRKEPLPIGKGDWWE